LGEELAKIEGIKDELDAAAEAKSHIAEYEKLRQETQQAWQEIPKIQARMDEALEKVGLTDESKKKIHFCR